MAPVSTRPLHPTDMPALADLIQHTWPSQSLNERHNQTVVVTEDVHGFCSGFSIREWDDKIRWEVDLLAVHPDVRGRGVGRALIRANLAIAEQHDFARAVVGVNNTASAAAFRACGFVQGRIRRTLVTVPPHPTEALEPDAVNLVRVQTLTYRGVWVEPYPGADYEERLLAGLRYAQQVAHAEGRAVVGAFASPQRAAALVEEMGAHIVGDYHWFIRGHHHGTY